jgi:phospholipase/lecithinase/hemolysin
MSDDSDLFNRVQDRNIEQVNRVANVLRGANRAMERQQPGVIGGRPDGTMEPAGQENSMEGLLRQIENHDAYLRTQLAQAQYEIRQLNAALGAEKEAREHLQGIIRQVADLIVNGSKGA